MTVFDAGVVVRAADDATPFLVMELIHGQTLRQRLADGPVRSLEAARLARVSPRRWRTCMPRGWCTALKPANVLLDDEAAGAQRYETKLTDFGIARLVDSTRLTMVGMTNGTANNLEPRTGHRPCGAPRVMCTRSDCATGMPHRGTCLPRYWRRGGDGPVNRAPDDPDDSGSGLGSPAGGDD